MATDVVIRIGAGGDYADLASARTYLNGLNLITLDQRIVVKLMEDQVFGNTSTTFSNTNTDSTRYIYVVPDDGKSWFDLHPSGVMYPPTTGLKITATAGSAGALNIDRGYFFDLLRFIATPTVAGIAPIRVGNTSSPKYTGIARSWVTGDHTVAALMDFRDSGSSSAEPTQAHLWDSVVIGTGTDSTIGLIIGTGGTLYRNTLIANNGAGRALKLTVPAANRGIWVIDNAIAGSWETVHTGGANLSAGANTNSRGNYLTGSYVQTGTGTTYPAAAWTTGATAASLFENIASSLRPSSTSALLGGATARAENKADINGRNRGVDPDIGAIQRNYAVPLPGGSIASQELSGQTFTASGTCTNTTSGELVLTGPSVIEVDIVITGGTWTVTYAPVPAGTFSMEIALANGVGGYSSLFGSAVVVDDTGGNPTGPEPDEPTEAPGVTWYTLATWLPGAASGTRSAVAPGVVLAAAVSFAPGAASGSSGAVAPGRVLGVNATWLPGAAAGTKSATATGALWEFSAAWLPGAVSVDAQAPGRVWGAAVSWLPGTAVVESQDAAAPGAAWAASAAWLPGLAFGNLALTPSKARMVTYSRERRVVPYRT